MRFGYLLEEIQLNRKPMDRGNRKNQKSIPTEGANVLLWNYVVIGEDEFAVCCGGSRFLIQWKNG